MGKENKKTFLILKVINSALHQSYKGEGAKVKSRLNFKLSVLPWC